MAKNDTRVIDKKTYSENRIEDALSKGNPTIKELFLDERVDDKDLFDMGRNYAGQIMWKYIGLSDANGNPVLEGKCFIGVNVKTSSNEPLSPISYRTTTNDYRSTASVIPEGGRITAMKNPRQEIRFMWDPTLWSPKKDRNGDHDEVDRYTGAVVDVNDDDVVNLFKSPYACESEGKKYNILGDIYYNALGMKKGECWVWIYHFDYDIDTGKYLSFVLAMGDNPKDYNKLMGNVETKIDNGQPKEEIEDDEDKSHGVLARIFGSKKPQKPKMVYGKKTDMDTSESPRNMLRNYILLVKARYVRRLERQRQVESIKSAVAAIMSRNMSHNLGSHYLYYTKMQLAALADSHQESAPDIRGAAKVLGYMQARMDYLATIVSGDKYPYGAVFFKGQIFDELTIDDFSKRHFKNDAVDKNRIFKRTTNYLLQNLILSENFTRKPVLDDDNQSSLEGGKKLIRLQIKIKENAKCSDFTGVDGAEEDEAKLKVSKITVALPGGIMSTHAFYNVIENFIRNSAKYKKDDFGNELVITIAIEEIPESPEEKLPNRYRFVIYDNKGNACHPYSDSAETKKNLVNQMNQQLSELLIWDNVKNELDKSNKGLKEMLFSTLWMRAYTYDRHDGRSEYLSDIIAQLERMPIATDDDRNKRMNEIRQHAFEYVAVDSDGKVLEESHEIDEEKKYNLGIRFELPKFRMVENVKIEDLKDDLLIEKGLNNFSDILCVDSKGENLDDVKSKFTRVYDGSISEEDAGQAVTAMKKILSDRFDDFDQYRLSLGGKYEDGYNDPQFKEKERGIYFQTHFADLSTIGNYAYCEAISGENFTKTMEDIFANSLCEIVENNKLVHRYSNPESEYFALKIKEAALTRITLIDERFYNDMMTPQNVGKGEFLKHKNIRILNLKSKFRAPLMKDGTIIDVKNMFDKNDFCDNRDATHFLSIHLGMIEKIVKEESGWVKECKLETKSLPERVDKLMEMLRNTFKTPKGELFITIHSGRGNFSKELDESLKEYPFMSISAIESVYANSKFLLAQLFYNTVYIGKGMANQKKEEKTYGK